jgi:multidrug efflux pump subunit AcrA (membrane-fusion protein)
LLWGLLALAVAFFPWQLRVPSDLTVMPQERQIVRAPADGRIARIHVSEGGIVEKGDLIVEYDTKELLLDYRTKQAELAQAREELRLLAKQNPTAREEIRVQERALETSRAQEVAARQEFERAQQAWTLGVLPKDRFDDAKSALEQAEARRREAEAQIELVKKSSPESRNEQMEVFHLRDPGAQQAVIEKLEAELAQLDDLISRSRIYASISGTLTTYRFEEKVGEFLEEGAEVCEIANDERVVIEMPVSEKEIDIVELNQPVKFKVRGYPTRSFHASVDEIAPIATPNGGSSSILVRAYVDNREKILKPGMTGVAKIYCGLSVVAHVLTRDIIRFIRTEFWL